MAYIFVYGSLRRDSDSRYFHQLLAPHAEYVAHGQVSGLLYQIDYYPGLVLTESESSENQVRGEIFSFVESSPLLAILDEYEGCQGPPRQDHEYRRVLHTVLTDQGQQLEVWIYEFIQPVSVVNLIHSGDFLHP